MPAEEKVIPILADGEAIGYVKIIDEWQYYIMPYAVKRVADIVLVDCEGNKHVIGKLTYFDIVVTLREGETKKTIPIYINNVRVGGIEYLDRHGGTVETLTPVIYYNLMRYVFEVMERARG